MVSFCMLIFFPILLLLLILFFLAFHFVQLRYDFIHIYIHIS